MDTLYILKILTCSLGRVFFSNPREPSPLSPLSVFSIEYKGKKDVNSYIKAMKVAQAETSFTPSQNQILSVLTHPGQEPQCQKTRIRTLISLCFTLPEVVRVLRFNCVFPVCFPVLLASELGVKFIAFSLLLGLSPLLHRVNDHATWTFPLSLANQALG